MTSAPHTTPSSQQSALQLLMSRQSRWPLTEPAPSQAELDQVLDLALRAPDHGQLQPWRFVVVRGEARQALGEVFVQAAKARDPHGDPQGDAERFRHKAMAAPLLIAMGAHLRPGHKVPQSEQLLAVGAAAMNLLNGLHLLGYGGFWATGLNSHDARVKTALGFAATDALIGFLYIGTPKEAAPHVERPARQRFVREWAPDASLLNAGQTETL
ncbi:nitroreductase family protein [Variovorax sp. HJSM1_2]|uniref:nitroreductase family protein n=1 Tax=Variovorax sp. HJSM1_2 TaxID=3366263 RepID=UPI003BD001D3